MELRLRQLAAGLGAAVAKSPRVRVVSAQEAGAITLLEPLLNPLWAYLVAPEVEQPRLYKVVLINDDYTPREFVVQVLKAVFRTTEDQAYRIMMTAHQRGVCVVATFTRDVAESKAKEGTEMGRQKGYPLMFSTEPEE